MLLEAITLTTNDPAGPCPAVTDQMIVTVNPVATVNANVDQTICAGGTVTLAGAFGGGATSATWSAPSGTFSSATNMAATYTPTITSGTVTITLTTNDPAGPCPAVTDQMIVTVNANIVVNAGSDIMICPGASATLTATGATTYSWMPGGQTTSSITVNPVVNTTYTVTGTSAGCIDTDDVTVTIDVPPTASNPTPLTFECLSQVPAPNPAVVIDETDNSGVPTVTFISDVSNGLSCPEVITRTYRVMDACGLYVDVYQTITINDVTAPIGFAPANVTVQCSSDIPPVSTTSLTGVSDNCTISPTIAHISDISNGSTCPEIITRTYSITDDCGNQTLVYQTITVDDTTPPTASNPADISVDGGAAPAPDINVVTDEADNCSVPVVAWVSDITDGGNCPETITRTYSVTDFCGNQTLVYQIITIGDAILPTASNPLPVTVQCSADVPAPDVSVVSDEADNGTPPIVSWEDDTSDGNSCPETITRRYRVTDNCGNFIFVTQTITVQDVTAPVFAATPANVTVACTADVPAMTTLAYTDNCDAAGSVTGTDVSDGNSCPETITRTWTVTDACGNTTSTSQTIVVHDLVAPVFAAAPANVTVACAADVPAMTTLAYTDNCDAAGSVTGTDVSDGNSCPETITRTWTVTDACGNTTSTSQTILVHDLVAPVFAAAPAAVTVECLADVPAMTNLGYTDNCDPAGTVIGTDGPLVGGACGGTITRTWTYTDACGNTASTTQTITIDDTTPPTATNPATTTVPGGPAPAVDPAVVIDEADNCTAAPVVAFVSESSDGQPCPETITRIYSVTDDCGNSINVTHTILITDPFPPTASNPAPINVECVTDVPAPDVLVVTDEADNQGVPVVAWVSDVSDNGSCPEIITRTYSVTDVCNNQILVTQTITVNDITAPTASNPTAINVECIFDVPTPDINVVTDEADNCTAVPVVAHVSDLSDGNTCPETIIRTYSITDDCGNQSFVTQSIIVNDVTAPTASNPIGVTVECIFDVPAVDIAVVTDEADNCTFAPVVTHVSDVSDGNTCPETITRTYAVTDDCGNQTLVAQTIIVNDVTNPTASNPASVIVQLPTDVPAPDPNVVMDEADNCTSNPTVVWVSDVSNNGSCPEIITRTYSVTDDCGNTINVFQTITINDITLPSASNPVTVNVECIADVPAPDITVVTDETDNSGITPTVSFVEDVSDNGTCPETITRSYLVTDNCGNSITVQQTIIVNDVTPPTATAPASVTVACINDVPPVPLSANQVINDASDNCTAVPTVDWISDVSDNGTCPETITRTYRVMDDCGNQTLVTQIITVNDIVAPTASNPSSLSVECIFDVPVPDISVVTDEADNCTAFPVVAHISDVSDGNTCPETITRTYAVTDDCGNQTLVTQTIVVNDVTNPTASNPAPISVVSAAAVPIPDVSVVLDEADNCTTSPLVTWVSDVSDGNICNNEQITRTYQVTDDCGNSITVQQLITITAIYPTINGGTDQTVCEGESIILNATYSPATTVISWPNPIQNGTPFIPSVGSNAYTVTGDNYGCISTDQVNVTVNPLPDPSFIPDVNMGCQPLNVEFTNTSSSASPIVSCVWTMGDGTTLNGCGDQNYLFENAGFFTVGLTTTDANGCTNSVSYPNLIYVEPFPVADFSASEYELNNLMITSEVEFFNESVGASNYVWNFGDESASTVENPIHIFETEDAGSYVVTLVASSPLGCADTAYHTFTVTEELIYFVPNTFTPDGNQFNNSFQPVFTSGFDPFDFTLLIYNRWGELIFESHDASIGWDGTYGGELMQDGTYTWKINFKSRINDKKYTAVGHVNLIR